MDRNVLYGLEETINELKASQQVFTKILGSDTDIILGGVSVPTYRKFLKEQKQLLQDGIQHCSDAVNKLKQQLSNNVSTALPTTQSKEPVVVNNKPVVLNYSQNSLQKIHFVKYDLDFVYSINGPFLTITGLDSIFKFNIDNIYYSLPASLTFTHSSSSFSVGSGRTLSLLSNDTLDMAFDPDFYPDKKYYIVLSFVIDRVEINILDSYTSELNKVCLASFELDWNNNIIESTFTILLSNDRSVFAFTLEEDYQQFIINSTSFGDSVLDFNPTLLNFEISNKEIFDVTLNLNFLKSAKNNELYLTFFRNGVVDSEYSNSSDFIKIILALYYLGESFVTFSFDSDSVLRITSFLPDYLKSRFSLGKLYYSQFADWGKFYPFCVRADGTIYEKTDYPIFYDFLVYNSDNLPIGVSLNIQDQTFTVPSITDVNSVPLIKVK